MKERITKIIVAKLVQWGWKPLNHENQAAVAIKSFDTAVGSKSAWVYVVIGNEFNRINGSYTSEGRNILEPIFALLNKSASDDEIENQVAAFAALVQEEIEASYAVRLLPKKQFFDTEVMASLATKYIR